MKFSQIGSFVAVLLVSAITACQSGAVQGDRSSSESAAIQQTAYAEYMLGSGDRLKITVFGHNDLSGEFEVDGAGEIAMPLIGTVDALDLTTRQLEQTIVAKLDGDYILNPRVSAEVINYRPFYILGEVSQPGEFQYTSGLTVLNAVAAAGGFTYRANDRVVFIKSVDSTVEIKYALTTNTVVRPGDTIRIGERIF